MSLLQSEADQKYIQVYMEKIGSIHGHNRENKMLGERKGISRCLCLLECIRFSLSTAGQIYC